MPYFPRRNFGEPLTSNSNNSRSTFFNETDELDSDFDVENGVPHQLHDNRPFFPRVSFPSFVDFPRIANFYGRAKEKSKHMPRKKTLLELLNNCVKPGEMFDELQNDDKIYVSNESLRQLQIQSFGECGFFPNMMKTITQNLKFIYPTLIQKAVIPIIMQTRHNIVGHSHTGSGKTAAFLLPIVDELYRAKINMYNRHLKNSPYCIILSPTWELTEQLFQEAEKFGLGMRVAVARSYGGMQMGKTIMEIERGCDILILTIGRLRHHLNNKHFFLNNLRYFVLDEGDKLIKKNDNMMSIEACIKHPNYPPTARLLIFSASFNKEVRIRVDKLIKKNYVMVQIGEMNAPVDTVKQEFIEVLKQDKDVKLRELLLKDARHKILPDGRDNYREPKYKTMVFVMDKKSSDRIARMLCVLGSFQTMSINSDRTAEQRYEAYEKFKSGYYDVLVATDVTARGWDIQGVEHVINYDLPSDQSGDETYIHRIGRTGRAGNRGLATSFFDPENGANVAKAGIYIKYLQDKNNDVPDFLLRYSSEKRTEMRQQMSGQNNEFSQQYDVPKRNNEPRNGFGFERQQNMKTNEKEATSSSSIQPKNEITTQMHRQNDFYNNVASTSASIALNMAANQPPTNFRHVPEKEHRSPILYRYRQNLGNNKDKGISFLNDSEARKYSDCF